MPYSLLAKFISETLATCFAIFIGTSTIANELLPSTKGHGQGYFSTGLGFTFAFFISGAWFGKISAEMNPAMFFYLALRNKLEHGWLEFFVGSAGNLLGAFLGACLTFFYWAAHFWTIPLPQDPDPVSRLINGPADALSADAGRLASAFGSDSRPDAGTTFRDEAAAFGHDLVGGGSSVRHINTQVTETVHTDSPSDEELNNQNQQNGQGTGELQGLLEQMEQERRTRSESLGSEFFNYNSNPSDDGGMTSEHASTESLHQTGSYLQETVLQNNQTGSPSSSENLRPYTYEFLNQKPVDNGTKGDVPKKKVKFLPKIPTVKLPTVKLLPDKAQMKRIKDKLHLSVFAKKKEAKQKEALNAAFQAAIQADQAAKLTIFSTRPAKYNRFANFMQEMTATFCLVFGIQMMNMRLDYDEVAKAVTSPYTQGMFSTFFVISLILGLGGTTGFAVNPARDLGPRIAHALLPIPGKGDSEWHYGWIPVFAPFVGAALAAGAMEGMEALYESGMD